MLKLKGVVEAFFLSVFIFLLAFLQPVNRSGGHALLPAEGKNDTANLFALIVQAELKGNLTYYFVLLVALVLPPFFLLFFSTIST